MADHLLPRPMHCIKAVPSWGRQSRLEHPLPDVFVHAQIVGQGNVFNATYKGPVRPVYRRLGNVAEAWTGVGAGHADQHVAEHVGQGVVFTAD